MRIAILCNGRTLCAWQYRAIEEIAGSHELFLLTSKEPPPARHPVRHALYYMLNLAAIRNRCTRQVPFPNPALRITDRLDFIPEIDGSWARLPGPVLQWLIDRRVDAVVKFGLGLLRVPARQQLNIPILSYHHGDPSAFRGCPAGFYEVRGSEPYVGQVVQILSNRLDSGEALAFAQSRVSANSYKQTLVDAYRLSPLLLPKALRALERGERVAVHTTGRNHRLPSNAIVLRFALTLAWRQVRHLAYGAIIEKQWRVSSVEIDEDVSPVDAISAAASRRDDWQTLRVMPPHRFHADPFFHGAGEDMLVEAMSGRTGKGELMRIECGRQTVITGLGGHASYPAPVEEGGRAYVVPEISDWARPAIFSIEGSIAQRVAELDIDEPGLLDPTLLHHEGRVYLFANRADEGPAVLRLWSADSLFGRFEAHPESPVRVSIRGSRMAGEVRTWSSALYRLGQDFRTGYGDGIVAFRITELGPDRYCEEEAGAVSFDQVKGPHTVNARRGRLLFDWYVERFSPLAGVRRLMNRL